MWEALWSVVVVAVLAGVALLFIVDALREPTASARVAAFLAIAAGVAAGFALWTPWLPLVAFAVSAALYMTGRARGRTAAPKP